MTEPRVTTLTLNNHLQQYFTFKLQKCCTKLIYNDTTGDFTFWLSPWLSLLAQLKSRLSRRWAKKWSRIFRLD